MQYSFPRLLCWVVFWATGNLYAQFSLTIDLTDPEQVAEIDERFSSYNVEMAEVVGGDFWIPYDQMDTTRMAAIGDGQVHLGEDQNRYRYRPPVDLSNRRLRTLARALSPAFVRVSGSWANYVYFQDNDSTKLEQAPEGFRNVLSREEWRGVLDFAAATGADLMTSFTISSGVRDTAGRWTPEQAPAAYRLYQSAGWYHHRRTVLQRAQHAGVRRGTEGVHGRGLCP